MVLVRTFLVCSLLVCGWINLGGCVPPQCHSVVEKVKNYDPVGQLKHEIEVGLDEAEKAIQVYAESEAFLKSLEREVERGGTTVSDLEKAIGVAIQKERQTEARTLASQLKAARSRLSNSESRLELQTKNHEVLVANIRAGEAAIKAARDRAKTLELDLAASERELKFAEFMSKFSYEPSSITSRVAELEELIQQKVDANRAKAGQMMQRAPEVSDEDADEVLAEFKK